MTCAEVNEIFRNWCRSSCAEVHPCRSSIARYNLHVMQNTCSLIDYCNSQYVCLGGRLISINLLTALSIYEHLLKFDLAKKCMIVEELIMAEEQTKS